MSNPFKSLTEEQQDAIQRLTRAVNRCRSNLIDQGEQLAAEGLDAFCNAAVGFLVRELAELNRLRSETRNEPES